MKRQQNSRRVATILACIVLVFASGSMAKESGGSDFAKVRKNLRHIITGYEVDLSNPRIQAMVTRINERAVEIRSNMVRGEDDRLFPDFNLGGERPAVARKSTYDKLRSMARAYALPGGRLSGDEDLLEDIIYGLDYMHDNGWYAEGSSSDGRGWFHEVGIASILSQMTVLLYDELTTTQRSNYIDAVDDHNDLKEFVSSPQDGDVAMNTVTNICVAAVREDPDLMEKAAAFPSQLTRYVSGPPGNGFYRDGTYIDHYKYPYNFGYGGMVLGAGPKIMKILRGTRWDVTDEPWAKNLYNIAFDAFLDPLWKGRVPISFSGRVFVRKGAGTFGTGVLYGLAKLTEIAPPNVSRQLYERIKHHAQALNSVDIKEEGGSIIGIERMNHIMDSDSITARPGSYTPKVYHNGDRAIIKSENFAAEISAFSTRIATYEQTGKENFKGWHTGRGMTLLHTDGDERQYADEWKPTVDWYRLPGTTVVNKPLKDGAYAAKNSSEHWVGGSNLESVGAFGMSLGPNYTDMSGHKSWLTLGGNQIVCLGAGITNSDEEGPTETIVLNRKLNDAGDNTFVVDGAGQSTSLSWSETLRDPSYAWLENTGGYYFPGKGNLEAKREERSGKWTSINRNTGNLNDSQTYTNNFLTVWKDHGKAPSNASYEYVLLPGRDQNDVAAYASNPPFKILKNTPKVQAVVNNNQYAGNFWTSASAGIVTAHNPVSVVIENTRRKSGDSPGTLKVGVSDPTHKQETVRIEIDLNVDTSDLNSDRVSVVEAGQPLVLEIDVKKTYGTTVTTELERE